MTAPRILACSLLALSLAFPAGAQNGNTGAPLHTLGQHDLTTPLTGDGINVLYAPSEGDDPGFRAAIAALTGGVVDYFDAAAGTPDLATLEGYDCVHTWTNAAYADNVAFGDNLADYVDGGGAVVLGTFATFTTGNFLDGRIMDPGYNPVVSPTGTNNFSSSDYAGDGTTAIHDGVTAYECFFRDDLVLQGDGNQDGSYVDGEIAHAYRDDFKVIYSNGGGASILGCTGQWAELIANSCAAGAVTEPPTPIVEVPTLSQWSLAALALALLSVGIFVLRRRLV